MTRRRVTAANPSVPWVAWENAVVEANRARLTQRQRVMWLALVRCAGWRGDRWEAFPSRRFLAAHVGLDLRDRNAAKEVRTVLGQLEKAGLVTRFARTDRRGRQTTNTYVLATLPKPGSPHPARGGQLELFPADPADWAPDSPPVDNPAPQGGGGVSDPRGEGGSETPPQFLEVRLEEVQASKTRARPAVDEPGADGPDRHAACSDEEDQPTQETPVRYPGGEVNWREEVTAFLAALPSTLRPAPTRKVRQLVTEALDRDWDAPGLADYVIANTGSTAGPGWCVRFLETVGDPWRSDANLARLTGAPPGDPWCGGCTSPDRRIVEHDPDGSPLDNPHRCPRCHPLRPAPVDEVL